MVLGTPGPSIGAPNYVMVGRCVSLLDLEFLGVRRNLSILILCLKLTGVKIHIIPYDKEFYLVYTL